MSLSEALPELRRPFMPESVNFKIQTVGKQSALVVTYIDARHVADRLNTIVADNWSDEYEPVMYGSKPMGIKCTLRVYDVAREDVGTVKDDLPDNRMGGMKILYSDAFKRAGVKFGIGASLYTLPTTYVPKDHLKNEKYLTDETKDVLAKKYEKWLKEKGIKIFGDPLDHGDIEGKQGDIEVEDD
jgi:hypothetical protein